MEEIDDPDQRFFCKVRVMWELSSGWNRLTGE